MKLLQKNKSKVRAVLKNNNGEEIDVQNDGDPSDERVKLPIGHVGVSLGITKNLGNYESLRVDVWTSDKVRKGESKVDAVERLSNEILECLDNVLDVYSQDD